MNEQFTSVPVAMAHARLVGAVGGVNAGGGKLAAKLAVTVQLSATALVV